MWEEGGGIVCACKCGGGDVSRLFDLTPAQTDQTPIYTVRTQTMNKYTHLLHPHVGAPTRPSLTQSPTPPTHIKIIKKQTHTLSQIYIYIYRVHVSMYVCTYLLHPHVGALARDLEEQHAQNIVPVGVAPMGARLREEGHLFVFVFI